MQEAVGPFVVWFFTYNIHIWDKKKYVLNSAGGVHVFAAKVMFKSLKALLYYISVEKKHGNEDDALMDVTAGNWLTYFFLYDFNF